MAFQAIAHVRYGPEWTKNVVTPETRILADVRNGFLPAMSWVIPAFHESDHNGAGNQDGEQWVSTVVNAIGQSRFWDSTAIFVVWDDWGGFYDHVPPQYLDYDGLGIRTPLLVISPYAKHNYVSHVQYEFGSIVRFVEDEFGLGRLSGSDARANSLIPDCFDFSQKAHTFRPLPTSMKRADFIRADARPTRLVAPPQGDAGD